MIAGAIFHGALAPDAKGWPLLPEGKRMSVTPAAFAGEGGAVWHVALQALYAAQEGRFPYAGGLLDQPAGFLEAMEIFRRGAVIYRQGASALKGTLKELARCPIPKSK